MNKLDQARKKINEIDAKMAELFLERMGAAEMVAEYKKEHGLPVLDSAREQVVIATNSERIENDELRGYYSDFLRSVMGISRRYQQKLLTGVKIAYSGTVGAFAHIASCKLFPDAEKLAYPNFQSAYKAVESGECDACVLPIENSYAGDVGQVADLIFSGSLYINGMTKIPIIHDLLAVSGADTTTIKTVVSHPQALSQCDTFIKEKGYKTVSFENTALAAKYVLEQNDPTIGAIASAESAKIFGLNILERHINDSNLNATRFAVLSKAENRVLAKESGTHFVLMFTVRNEAGSLVKALEIIAQHDFNMLALRSRPMKELLWQYYFFVECEGNVHSESGKEMITELKDYCDKLKIAGSFKED